MKAMAKHNPCADSGHNQPAPRGDLSGLCVYLFGAAVIGLLRTTDARMENGLLYLYTWILVYELGMPKRRGQSCFHENLSHLLNAPSMILQG